MNLRVISRNVGFALLVSALFMFLSALVSMSAPSGNDSALAALIISGLVTFIVGIFPFIFVRKTDDISLKDGYMIICLSWLLSFVFGMLPYALWGGPFTIVNAWFESVSGFTTTGATILSSIETIPDSLLFWRSSTHFIGGLGVVVFLLLIIPASSPTRFRLTNMEISSLSRDTYRSRGNKTVRIFAIVYIGLVLASFLCYWIAGMSVFDAINHAFSVVATGGFSTKNNSIASFNSTPIAIITIIFMLLSSIHFGLIFILIATRSIRVLNNAVLKFYLGGIVVVSVIIVMYLRLQGLEQTWSDAAMAGVFQTVSLASTTGFAIADNATWPLFPNALILLLTITCGCAGSTTGGVKADRVLILIKSFGRQVRKVISPSAVSEIRVDKRVVRDELEHQAVLFIALYLLILLISALCCLFVGVDDENAFSACLSSLANAGPSLGKLGNLGNYGSVSTAGKIILTIDMFLGRLEIYPILAVISMMFTRKKNIFGNKK